MKRLLVETKEELEQAILEAKKVLESGGVILYPTDTVYGIGADATNPEAVKKVYVLKGREAEKALLVVVSDIQMASEYVEVNSLASKIAEKTLPGAMTLLLPKKDVVIDEISGGTDELGVRIPDSFFCLQLAQEFGKPYTSTSANISREKYKLTIDEQLEQFGDRTDMIDLIIDVGVLPPKKPSTILRIKENSVEVVREGNVNLQALAMVTKGE